MTSGAVKHEFRQFVKRGLLRLPFAALPEADELLLQTTRRHKRGTPDKKSSNLLTYIKPIMISDEVREVHYEEVYRTSVLLLFSKGTSSLACRKVEQRLKNVPMQWTLRN